MKGYRLPKIYPITDRRISGLSHEAQVKLLIRGGAKIIQLREKTASPADFYEDAKKALEIGRKEGVKIIINDRIDIAMALKADGVHLGQDDLSPVYARKFLGEEAIIGFSSHSREQAIAALRHPIDYLAIGPVFKTLSKDNPDKEIGIAGLIEVRASIAGFPLVAIGGIGLENAPEVASIVDSIALISAIISKHRNIVSNMQSFVDIC